MMAKGVGGGDEFMCQLDQIMELDVWSNSSQDVSIKLFFSMGITLKSVRSE